ncbi:DUF6449 domain-containing protein [Paenibacillus durus]|uniref:Multidrug ABC transporter permease n=1 Tax=Paenibacillus durus TaxID=44251 RepID=A0A089IR69_PAEDU|nr:DUF6449 domain-containing protein [Paenibacillus durus]AIQ11529.1 hypothetical protein PDUR_05895 [Paenibacillus durus]
MTSRRFFFNSGMIRQNFRQHSWIAIIYFLGLLFGLPLQVFLGGNPDAPPQPVDNLFRASGDLFMVFPLLMPVAAGLLLFRYLQHKGAADAMHSLPLRRRHLLTAQLFSGSVLLLVPVWLTALAAGLVRTWDGNRFLYSGADVWAWGAAVSILTLFLFAVTAFVGICIGLTVLHGIIVYILLLLPAVLSQLALSHFRAYLYGFPDQSGFRHIDNWSPILHMLNVPSSPFTWSELGIYAALTVLLILLSYLLYRKRRTETAGLALAFTYFNPLFKGGVMLCAMLISGTYLADMRTGQTGWALAGYALGAVIGYAVSEMVIRKSWLILDRKLPARFAGYALILGLLLYLPVSPVTGYEARVPDADKITGVYIGDNYYWGYVNPQNAAVSSTDSDTFASPFRGVDPFSSDPAYASAVRKLHEALVQVRPGEGESRYKFSQNTRLYTFAYKLNNGRTMTRQYVVPLAGFEPELKTVMESEGFKRAEYVLPQLDKPLASIQLHSSIREAVISDPAEINEFKALLKKEILNLSFKDQTDDTIPLAYINIIPEESIGRSYSFINYDWKSSYHELGAWLERKGYADRVKVKADDVLSAELAKQSRDEILPNGYTYDPAAHLKFAQEQGRSVIIKDKARINNILEIRRNYTPDEGTYVVLLKYRSGNSDYSRIDAADLTPEIKALLP